MKVLPLCLAVLAIASISLIEAKPNYVDVLEDDTTAEAVQLRFFFGNKAPEKPQKKVIVVVDKNEREESHEYMHRRPQKQRRPIIINNEKISAQAKVRSTAILFQHGERTPVFSIPGLNNELSEDIGYGQLTNTGSRQLYENGILLRTKYHHLMPEEGFFRLSNMQIMSSVPERTMLSLQSFMAGFFPPPLFDNNLPLYWQPFFHTVDNAGRVVYMEGDSCPKVTKASTGALKKPTAEMVAMVEQDRVVLDQISKELGIPLNTFMDVGVFSDYVRAQMHLDPDLPEWLIEAYDSTLAKYMLKLFEYMHSSKDLIRLRGGPMVTQILANMEAIANNQESGKNFLIYSAHDATVSSLAYALGVEEQIPALANYSDTIMVDLLDNEDVEVVYMNTGGVIHTRSVLNVPGCGKSCPLSTFRQAVKDMLISDAEWDALCAV